MLLTPSTPRCEESELPGIDDRLVVPETPYEMLDGELIYYPPNDEIRGARLVELGALIDAHADVEFHTAMNVLMRTSKVDDIALNISVYAAAPDPRTGHRQFPRLAFEIVHTEALGYSGRKAAKVS